MEFLVLIGLLGILVSIILFIISLFKKQPKKKALLLLVISFILMVTGALNINKKLQITEMIKPPLLKQKTIRNKIKKS